MEKKSTFLTFWFLAFSNLNVQDLMLTWLERTIQEHGM